MQLPRSLLVFSILAALATTVAAQARVFSPAPLGYHVGMTSTGYPFGYTSYTKMTYQQIHGDLPSTLLFKNLAWRPASSTASHGGFTATLTLTFGTNGPTPDNATTTFSTNLGANPQVVINNGTVNIGAYTKPTQPPGAFVYKLPLPTTYVYTGNGTFCWECRLHNHTGTQNLSFDLYYTQSVPTLRTGGTGCTASGATAPASLTGTISGSAISLAASNMPAAGGSMLLVGLNPTPFDLTASGAPCSLRTDILALLPGAGSGSSATWTGSIPTTVPDGVAVFLQAGAADAQANNMGLVLSNGLCTLWPYAKRPVIRNWVTNSDTATTGNLQLTYGLVIELSL
jgi:hypothetical protein